MKVPNVILGITADRRSTSNQISGSGPTNFAIIDVRRTEIAHLIRDEMLASLQPCGGKVKEMPSIFLFDEIGLKLFEAITFLDEVLVK